ncbi:MAG: nucleotidyl transferase AbiEii/AbiGii toxin family protein [Oscillospiraceae bacterium]|jgi:predicted nucleotidyltransferase component of viral defense system|nr:nucleotidyl transferase AbiEii/AbiGii toxin family protein [Oscillospiraceae bacterium]
MKFKSTKQLKDWIKNKSKDYGTPANTLLQTYMMERLLERISMSHYRNNIVLKGGFLISSMIGISKRSTKDMDTTMIGLPISRDEIERIIKDVISIKLDDNVSFTIKSIENIHEDGDYDDFRILFVATFLTIREFLQLDITVGDAIIPCEIEYKYKLMFEDREIPIMAYNLYTILAEKIGSILSRNVSNSRGRDFYDTFILISLNRDVLLRDELLNAIRLKAIERNTLLFIENYQTHLNDISNSPEIAKIWTAYIKSYSYAEGISLSDSLSEIAWVFEPIGNKIQL